MYKKGYIYMSLMGREELMFTYNTTIFNNHDLKKNSERR